MGSISIKTSLLNRETGSLAGRLFFMVLFLFVVSVFCHSQTGKISGTLSFENGKPVGFAIVYISSLQKHAVSDDRGHYELADIPYGTHLLEFRTIEAEKKEMTVTVEKPTSKLSVKLKEKGVELREVVVNATSEKRKIETAGFAVNIIETERESLKNLQTNELLNRTVGVNVRQNGGMGSSVNYNLNGMSGNSVRIFVNGIPISTYGASFSLSSIPPTLIERIEVYKGVIPAHLADDALGGAINVVLKKSARNNLTASLSYGSFNTYQANFSGMFRNDKSGFTIKTSGFYNYSDNDYEVWGKFVRNILPNGRYEYVRAKRFNDAYKSIGGQVEVGFTEVEWADQFLVGYNGSDDYNEIQHGTYMSIPYKGRFTESQSHVLSLSYRKKDIFTKGLEFSFNGMYSSRNQMVNDTVKWNYDWSGEKSIGLYGDPILRPNGAQQGAPTINHTDRNIVTFRSGLGYEINEHHRVVLNHSYYTIDRKERDEMRSAIEREFIGTRDLQKNIASVSHEMKAVSDRLRSNVFVKYYQQKIDRIDPKLTVVDGENVRVEDRINSNKETFGYGLALSYAVKPDLMLLTSAEKAVRMPSENEIFGSVGENIVENTGISPEISNNVNIGFKAGPYNIQNHRIYFSGTGFLRDTKDKIVQRINPRLNDAIQTSPYENLGKTKSIGFEVEANYNFNERLDLMLNLSKFNTVFNMKYDPNGAVYDYYDKQMPNEPFFTLNGTAQYAFPDLIGKNSALNVYYNFNFVERFYTTWLDIEEFRTPRQYIQDLGASYTFPDNRFVVSLDVKNIFDKQAYDNFAVHKPGRAFYLKINYVINNF